MPPLSNGFFKATMAAPISLEIREKREEDSGEIVNLVKLLPEYFPDPNDREIETNVASLKGLVAVSKKEMIGFILFRARQNHGEIYAMAVHPSFQRGGIGQRLIEEMEKILSSEGIHTIQVRTLAETPKIPHFHKTRKFYNKCGYDEISRYQDRLSSSIEIMVLEKTL